MILLMNYVTIFCCILPASLEIAYTSTADDGTYECVASNDIGVAYSAPARLIVEGKSHMENSTYFLYTHTLCILIYEGTLKYS